MRMPPDPGMTPRDRYIPLYFVAFFAVVFAVNGVFVTLALKTMPGVTNDNAFQTGLKYNETLDKAAKEQALGWQLKLDGIEQCANGTCSLTFAARDKAGVPIVGAEVVMEAVRPARQGMDFAKSLTTNEQGLAVLNVSFPARGAWNLFLTLRQDGKETRQLREVVVK